MSFFFRVLSRIYTSHSTLVPEAVIALDAEKAFDQTETENLFIVPKKLGLCDKFRSWI